MASGGKRTGAGRKKGFKGKNTLNAETARAALIAAYIKNAKPINEALIKKAKKGDIYAIRELHERVFGKVMQPLGGDKEHPIIIKMNEVVIKKYTKKR